MALAYTYIHAATVRFTGHSHSNPKCIIFAPVRVATTNREMTVIRLGEKYQQGTKLYVHFGVSVYYICKHLYFSCENVDIYENVNIRSMNPVLPVLWK